MPAQALSSGLRGNSKTQSTETPNCLTMSENRANIQTPSRSNDSLFSLEMVVDKLSVPGVVCRFPAVAFRLLDFPTLIIYHVESDLGDTIKTKISADPHYCVPPQLNELKNKEGHFVLKKGKSCLFKIPPKILHAHLMNAPLYVMLIDTYPEVPKLIGSCSIPLDDVMDLVFKDISNYGVSVPNAHGERGEYKVFNLMGQEIGFVVLGYRLLSLGMGLIPHIPDNAISTYQSMEETVLKEPEKRKGDPTTQRILQSIQAADKNIQVAISEQTKSVDHQHSDTQTGNDILQAVATQTMKYKKKKSRTKQRQLLADSKVSDEMTDFFITNMVCPPPMFFNSEVEEAPVLHQGLTFNDFGIGGIQAPQPTYAWGKSQQGDTDDSSSWSDEDTIRHEDKFSDSDVEEIIDFKSSRVVRKESKKAVIKKTLLRGKNMTDAKLGQQGVQILRDMSQKQPQMANLQQLPLLNALLKEIMSLKGVSMAPEITTQVRGRERKTSRPTSARTPRESDRMEGREHRGELLSRLATPRGARTDRSESPSTKSNHRVCAAGPETVPRNKSWLRKNPEFTVAVKKTKLTYGMTNAQRLRLIKTNPKLLEELEKDQRQRVERSRKQTLEKYSHFRRESILGGRLMRPSTLRSSRGKGSFNIAVSFDSTGDQLSDMSRSQRKPVPTPRKSLSAKSGQALKEAMPEVHQVMSAREESAQHIRAMETPSRQNIPSDAVKWTAHQERSVADDDKSDSQRTERSQKSIEVHLPNAAAPDSDVNTSEESIHLEGDEDSIPAFGRTKTLYNPGFPSEPASGRESRMSGRESRFTDYGQYSEDFENYYDVDRADRSVTAYSVRSSGEEPSLRKIIDKYSDSDETEASGEEPSLRKVVEQYSEDDINDFESVRSHDSEPPERVQNNEFTNSNGLRLKLPNSVLPNPMVSDFSPVAAMRQQIPLTREGITTSSTPSHTDVASQEESTAYFRRSQIPTVSYETGTSLENQDDVKNSGGVRPQPSPRRTLERMSSVHTESVSSYAPSDVENASLASGHSGYSNEFELSDDDNVVQPVKQMSELRLAPEAKMGYTWGY